MKHGQIAEYRDAPSDQFSKVTTLDSGINEMREFFLKHHTPGFELAGSMARWNDYEMWSVTFEMGGATNGRRFLKKGEAQDLFDKWTGRDVQIEAQIVRDEIRKEG
jgi:hypothetical protein